MLNTTLQLYRVGHHTPVTLTPCVATIGNFDGCHLGHQSVIEKVIAQAKAQQLPATVITFHPMPQNVFKPEQPLLKLISFKQKIKLLAEKGIERVVVLRFKEPFYRLSATQFIEHYLVKQLQVKHLVIGDNFRFGHQQQGDVKLLAALAPQFGFTCESIALDPQQAISSTRIRRALLAGDCHQAGQLLGRPFHFTQRVIRGKGIATQWGIPTANVPVPVTDPSFKGIFVVRVKVAGGTYGGVANLGTRPTIDGKNYLLEAHLFDFAGDLYGKRITIELLHKLRDEQRFESLDALRQQIEKDIRDAQEYFKVGLL